MAVIEPTRHQILGEHCPRVADIMPIVKYNPFVPPGREQLFAQGLYFGLVGQFDLAIHLLLPQIENSIRYVLTQRGVIVSGLDQKGVQDERSLNTTLYYPETAKILGEDMVFTLKGLLVERSGANMRNLFAHGLMNNNDFYNQDAVYCWAITLRLCLLPKLTVSPNTSQ